MGILTLSLLFFLAVNATDYCKWMGDIGNDVYLNDFSIPGSHDAGTYAMTSTLAGGIENLLIAQCQSYTFADQLSSGVRFFDFRFTQSGTDLVAFHGIIVYTLTANDVLTDCQNFLTANPTETILILLRFGNDSDVLMWNDLISSQFSTLQFYGNYTKIPQLSECRGKIVIFSWDERLAPNNGYSWPGGDNVVTENALIHIEDLYESVSISNKETALQTCIDATAGDTRIHVCYASLAASISPDDIGNPFTNAAIINADLLVKLALPKYLSQPLGIIGMDFPQDTTDLINSIIVRSDGSRTGQCSFYIFLSSFILYFMAIGF